MVATGICHSDIAVASIPGQLLGIKFPKVLGHEGAGVVEEVGPGVTVAKVGDPVLLSYSYCNNCDLCNSQQQPYCSSWQLLNIFGESGIFETTKGEELPAKFFGQSSFAATSIVGEGSVVNVKDLIKSTDDLKLLAPMGCGLMTGSGAIMNGASAKPHDIVLVTGIGAVGLGAVMAAKIAGCKEVIAVDRVAHRLETAKELGATKALDTSTMDSSSSIAENIQKLVEGQRISIIIETTGAVPVVQECIKALGRHGRLIQLGVPRPGSQITLPLSEFFGANKSFECHYLGNTTGQAWIPVMIQWWREGRFPIEKIVKTFPAKDALLALQGMEDGSAIKPVLLW
ncbi:Alcohol dehydrogenase GroES-like domain-containing protein [Cladophialophora immunda]|nr:Alcohol dehydrogenase GroES-like domain-containing protein [Cladophialophora immunda]